MKRHLAAQGVYNGGKRFDVVDKRLVPNAAEQAALAEMRAMRQAGASLRRIGAAVGLPAPSVKRILDRAPA